MKLFERFDRCFVISLPERKDRLDNFRNEVKKYDLGDFKVIEAIKGDSTFNGVSKGNMGLIKSISKIFNELSEDTETVLIMEDDCVFSKEIKKIDDYFNSLPLDWDMLYMGGNHNVHVGAKPPIRINDMVCKLSSTATTHFVAIKRVLFPEIMEFLKMPDAPIDVFYMRLQKKYNAYSFYPAIATQKEGFSDIEERMVNYNWLIK